MRDLGYRPDIDGLRAVAVMGVLLYHSFPNLLPGGFAGVDVFFVISGFLISRILIDSMDAGTFRFSRFYARRARRLFPALVLVLVTSLAAGWALLLPDEFRSLGKHIAAGAGFYSNFAYLGEAGYFDTLAIRKPLLHLWSLAIEEQFYILWPLCLTMLWKRRPQLLSFVTAGGVISFVVNVILRTNPSLSYYLPVTRFWELLAGCALACPYNGRFRIAKRAAVRGWIASAGAVLILFSFMLLNEHRLFPGYWALLPVAGTAFIMSAGPEARVNQWLAQRRLVFIGLLSYPLYLWHWPLLSFAQILGYSATVHKLMLLAAAFVLSWLTWRYAERPIRLRPPDRRVAFLATGIAAAGLAGFLVFSTDGIAGRPQAASAAAVIEDIQRFVQTQRCPGGPWTFQICAQSGKGTVDAAVMGDSHAVRLLQGLTIADRRRNWLAIGNLACPPVIGVIAQRPDRTPCPARTADALSYLDKLDGPKVVVLAFFGYFSESMDFAADQIGGANGPSQFRLEGKGSFPGITPGKETALYEGLRNLILKLMSRDRKVIFVIDVPELPFLPRDCIKRPYGRATNCTVPRSVVDQRQRGIRRIAAALQTEFPRMQIFDPLPLICGRGDCIPVQQSHSWYADSHHLSVWGSEMVARSLLAQLDDVPQ